jgi:glutathione S-transferase
MLARQALSWSQLASSQAAVAYSLPDQVSGPTNPQTTLRLFGRAESEVRVTLFRDNHAWVR